MNEQVYRWSKFKWKRQSTVMISYLISACMYIYGNDSIPMRSGTDGWKTKLTFSLRSEHKTVMGKIVASPKWMKIDETNT